MSTETQMFREVPFHRFSPWEPRKDLPDGAFLGQVIETNTSDNAAYRVMKNSATALGDMPVPLETQFTEVTDSTGSTANIAKEYAIGDRALQIRSDGTKFDENQFVTGIFYKTAGDSDTYAQMHGITYNKESVKFESPWDYQTEFYIEPPLFSDWDDDASGNLVMHPLHGVTASKTGPGAICGVSVCAVPADYYFLGLVRGTVWLETDAISTPAGAIGKSGSNAGHVKRAVPGEQVIGHNEAPSDDTLGADERHFFYINFLSRR